MDEISREEFDRLKNEAEERLRKMNRSDMPPFPSFVKIPEKKRPLKDESSPPTMPPLSAEDKHPKKRFGSFIEYLNIPKMLENSDAMLLLSLILLLSSEDADETLILALAYILL